jgi:hypothetical protein
VKKRRILIADIKKRSKTGIELALEGTDYINEKLSSLRFHYQKCRIEVLLYHARFALFLERRPFL